MTAWWAFAVGGGLAVWPVIGRGAGRWATLMNGRRLPPPSLGADGAGSRAWWGGARSGEERAGAVGAGRAVWGSAVLLAMSITALVVGPALAVAASAVAVAVAAPLRAGGLRRRRRRFRRDLSTAIGLLQGELGAGASVAAALLQARDRAGTARGALSFDVEEHRPGGGDPGVATITGDADQGAVRRALRASAAVTISTGVAWSEVIDGVAADLSAHDARDDALQAALAGARASMLLLAGLPVVGLVLAAGLGAHPLHFLLHTSAGRLVLAAGATLQAAGVLALLALVRRAER